MPRTITADETQDHVASLRAIPHPAARRLADAITTAVDGTLSFFERRAVNRIEAARERLNNSSERLVFSYDEGGPETRERSVAEICKKTSVFRPKARLLFQLIRRFKPTHCLEMGTSVGISGAYQAAALELNKTGRLVSLEGAGAVAQVAERTWKELGFSRASVRVGRFQDTLDAAIAELAPIDYAFIDGHHDEHATLDYLNRILPHTAPSCVLIFDDITWSDGMRRAWDAIAQDPRLPLTVGLSMIGLVVRDPQLTGKRHVSAELAI